VAVAERESALPCSRQNSTFSPHLRQELVAYAEGGPASAFSRVDEIECGKKRIKVTVGASKWPN